MAGTFNDAQYGESDGLRGSSTTRPDVNAEELLAPRTVLVFFPPLWI